MFFDVDMFLYFETTWLTEHFNDARLVDLALNQAAKSNDFRSEKGIIFGEDLDKSVHFVTCDETWSRSRNAVNFDSPDYWYHIGIQKNSHPQNSTPSKVKNAEPKLPKFFHGLFPSSIYSAYPPFFAAYSWWLCSSSNLSLQ